VVLRALAPACHRLRRRVAYLGVATSLANYKKPRRVVFVDALPRNALGKVLKHEVRRELIEAEE
jgi:non-ribosomal peptide synthetase component E (peptide arylation enzyme)